MDAEHETAATELKTAVARSASLAAVSYLLVQFLAFGSYVALARLTTPDVFGRFAAGSILLGYGAMLTESGMTAALLQRRDRIEEAASTALASTFVGGVLLALISLALAPLVALFFGSSEIGLVAAALSGYFILNGLIGVPATLLQKRFRLRRWVVEPVAVGAFGVAAAVGLASGLGVWGLVIGMYASAAVRVCGYWLAVRWLPKRHAVSFGMWRELAAFARHILVSELLQEGMRVTNTALIARLLGPASLGEFRFGFRLVSQAAASVLAASAYTIQPTLVRLADDQARSRAAVLAAFKLVSLIAFPLGALFIPLGEPLAVVLFGEAWRGSGPIMMALSGMGIALGLESVPSEVFKARGRPDILPRMHALWATLLIGLMVPLVHFGALGVAFAWSASTVCVALYALRLIPRVVDVRLGEIALAIAPPLLSATVMVGSLLVLDRYVLDAKVASDGATMGRLLLELLFGGVIYLLSMALVARGTLRETAQAISSMTRRRVPPAPPDTAGVDVP
jgi:O-antigen/teichoic acid export membrane protein